jgi:hypothetical protein
MENKLGEFSRVKYAHCLKSKALLAVAGRRPTLGYPENNSHDQG